MTFVFFFTEESGHEFDRFWRIADRILQFFVIALSLIHMKNIYSATVHRIPEIHLGNLLFGTTFYLIDIVEAFGDTYIAMAYHSTVLQTMYIFQSYVIVLGRTLRLQLIR